ncbi:MAG: M2 family metallopeptidase [Gemmatimonadota bacterium]
MHECFRRMPGLVVLASVAAAGGVAGQTGGPPRKPTVAEARAFVARAESTLNVLGINAQRMSWVQSTYITDDTEQLAAEANDAFVAASTRFAMEAARYNGLRLDPVTARKLDILKRSLVLAAPRDPGQRAELTRIAASMEGDYGKGKYCPAADRCLDLGDLSRILATSRDPDSLKQAWLGWHAVSPPYRQRYARLVELGNAGARSLGFRDMGAMWRSNYDMPPDAFAAEMERLWQQVRPLYVALHTYARKKLREKYGPDVVPASGPIPAHLLGNMWSQDWSNIYDLLQPPSGDPGFDLTKILRARKTDARQMVRYGEGFFTSLGLRQLPATFWQRSLFTKPQDRDVVCHASAWDIDNQQDVRIKMCIEINAEDFSTIHHELGHNYYQMAYAPQPPLFQNSANDGFHEAIGDAIALSVTPEYLKQLGFIDRTPDESADLGLLMRQALAKVAFLPFGYLVDQWRWKVFSGEISPADYNRSWWDLRLKYQGIASPEPRTEADFDAGAKYHVAANVPYARYFLAAILQFQFHRAMCREAGYRGPLHRCSIYGNRQAGARLEKMMAMGMSRPWPEALEALTGEKQLDATAILDYFAPLKAWLDEQNRGEPQGW